jgi:hypothetical protein
MILLVGVVYILGINRAAAMSSTRKGTKKENRRLGSRESDWNLIGQGVVAPTRTRGGGKRKTAPEPPDSSSTSDEEWELEESEEDTEEDEDEDEISNKRKAKPKHKRAILEVSHVKEVFEKFGVCPECGGQLTIEVPTICITSSLFVSCKNEHCEFVGYTGDTPCAKTTMHEGDNYERMTDYALNVLYVLGFVSIGDGHTEAGRILGLCGLPNDTTMNTRSFHIDKFLPELAFLGRQ